MKKTISAILLSGLLVMGMSSCHTASKIGRINTNESNPENIDQKTTDSNADLETIEGERDAATGESDSETMRDIPGVGQLKRLPSGKLEKATIWMSDETDAYYLYIREWDAYRSMTGLSSYHNWRYLTDHCIAMDDEAATIALIDQKGKHDEPTILTYRFHRSNELVELHAVPLNVKASSEDDTFLINMHDTDHGYYFLTPRIDGNLDDRNFGAPGWPLFLFETADGGKSWNQISTNTFSISASDGLQIFKFLSPCVGVIGFRHVDQEDLSARTFFTLDGGLTWAQIAQLPYPFDLEKTHDWYSEIVNLKQNEDCYELTVEIRGTLVAAEGAADTFPSEYTTIEVRFASKDLIHWSLMETESNKFKRAAESEIPAFVKCANTYRNRFTPITNSFFCPYTNGFAEGCNNRIKVLKRNAYSVQNFKRFRNRILFTFSDKSGVNA